MSLKELALDYHRRNGVGNGKIEVIPKVSVNTREKLALAYTPGVAVPCLAISEDESKTYDYTVKGNTVLVVSDGTAVLGLGDIGCRGGIPVMEGKALLFKIFGGVDAYPVVLDTKDPDKIVETVKLISPIAGGINLEDISAPRCFEIEQRLASELDIPVFHDDQHGTAVVCLAGLTNALKITGKKMGEVKIVINGAGSAGVAIARLLLDSGAKNVVLCDTKGAVYRGRTNGMNPVKDEMSLITNPASEKGALADVMRGADVFLGVSAKDAVSQDMVRSMARDPVLFAMANPDPEILPDAAYEAGAAIVATGRSDFANQVNNCLGFPAIFRGLLDVRAKRVTQGMKLAAAAAIAGVVTDRELEERTVIPSVFEFELFAREAEAVARQAVKEGVARVEPAEGEVYRRTKEILEANRKRFFE